MSYRNRKGHWRTTHSKHCTIALSDRSIILLTEIIQEGTIILTKSNFNVLNKLSRCPLNFNWAVFHTRKYLKCFKQYCYSSIKLQKDRFINDKTVRESTWASSADQETRGDQENDSLEMIVNGYYTVLMPNFEWTINDKSYKL